MKTLILATALFNACLISVGTGQSSQRTLIEVFDYSSDNPGNVDEPVKLLQSRIERLAEQTFKDHPNLETLQDLRVEGNPDPYPATIRTRADYWKNSTKVLAFLNGEIRHSEGSTKIVSNIYLGEDKGSLQGPMITVRTDWTIEKYSFFHDLHCAATLYALAIEAVRSQADRGVVSQYLAETKSLLGESVSMPSAFESIRNDLLQAVTNQLMLLKQQGGGP